MSKSADAFRTISEVAEWLGVQTHVLRFWESKFSQVRPVKRAGGRRYYRPADMLLLGGIRRLLHEDGLTIKGVQKVLREEGVAYVADMSQPLDALTSAELDEDLTSADSDTAEAELAAPAPSAKKPAPAAKQPAPSDQPELPWESFEPAAPPVSQAEVAPPIVAEPVEPDSPASTDVVVNDNLAEAQALQGGETDVVSEAVSEPQAEIEAEDAVAESSVDDRPPAPADVAPPNAATPDIIVAEPVEPSPEERAILDAPAAADDPEVAAEAALQTDAVSVEDEPSEDVEDMPGADRPAKPAVIDVPDTPALEAIPATPGLLSRAAALKDVPSEARVALPDLRAQLGALRDRMANDAARQG